MRGAAASYSSPCLGDVRVWVRYAYGAGGGPCLGEVPAVSRRVQMCSPVVVFPFNFGYPSHNSPAELARARAQPPACGQTSWNLKIALFPQVPHLTNFDFVCRASPMPCNEGEESTNAGTVHSAEKDWQCWGRFGQPHVQMNSDDESNFELLVAILANKPRKWNRTFLRGWVTGGKMEMEQEDIDRELFELARKWMEIHRIIQNQKASRPIFQTLLIFLSGCESSSVSTGRPKIWCLIDCFDSHCATDAKVQSESASWMVFISCYSGNVSLAWLVSASRLVTSAWEQINNFSGVLS